MADINVSKTESVVTVNATTNEVTVTQTPTTVVIQSQAYSPVSSVNAKTGDVVLSTTDITEGTNLYYSTARFDTRLASKSTTDITEGANLYYTTDRFDTRLATKSINVLSDVNTTTAPANGQSLIWNSATSQWVPGDGVSSSTSAVNITNINTEDDTFFLPFVRATSGSQNLSADSSLTYNPNTNTLGTGLNFNGTAANASLVTIAQAATDSAERPVLFKLDTSVAYDQDNTITYNPLANRLSVTNLTVSGTLTGTVSNATTAGSATTAGTAQNVQVTSSPTWPSTAYPMFSTQATGAIGPLTDTGLTYLPSTNTLTTTTFAGALTGNADTATTATNATNVTVTTMPTATSVQNILFVGGTSGNQLPRASGSVYYDNTTSQIYSGYQIRSPNGFSGDLTGGVNATNNSGITFYEETVNGGNYITLQAPTALSANYNLRLPSTAGTNGYVLSTNGSGTLSWVAQPSQYTDALARAAISGSTGISYNNTTGVITNTITQYTDALARAAVSATNTGTGYGTLSYDSATGVFTLAKVTGANIRSEVVDGRNLTYTTSTLDLDKTLTAVNSITAEAATNLTLVGDELQLNTVDVTTASQFLNLNSTGYTYDLPQSTFSVALNRAATTVGTTSATFNHYILTGNVTNGSNVITNVVVTDIYGDAVVNLSTVTDIIGVPLLDYDTGYFNLGVAVSAISYSGAYDPDPGTNAQVGTLTLSVQDSAITATANCQGATGTDLAFDICHYIRNATATNVCMIGKDSTTGLYEGGGLYRDASNNGSQDGAALAVTYASYSYTGTQDWQITPRRVLKLQPKNVINEHVNIPFGLGVGPGAISTDRGVERASNDTVGINIHNNGKLIGYALPTGVTLTQFKNNSYFSSGVTAERCGPTFTFNSFAGDSDTATNALYLTDQDGVGQIKFFATPASSSLASFASAPASITAKATETHNSSTKQGVGLYLQYSPNSQTAAGRPKTFLRAENATTELLAKTTLKLSRITTGTGSSTAVLSQAAQSTWLTLDDTAATFTVPVKFPVYTKTAAAAITGSVGMQICISDSAGGQHPNGMMAFWDTTNARWSYIHDNTAL